MGCGSSFAQPFGAPPLDWEAIHQSIPQHLGEIAPAVKRASARKVGGAATERNAFISGRQKHFGC